MQNKSVGETSALRQEMRYLDEMSFKSAKLIADAMGKSSLKYSSSNLITNDLGGSAKEITMKTSRECNRRSIFKDISSELKRISDIERRNNDSKVFVIKTSIYIIY